MLSLNSVFIVGNNVKVPVKFKLSLSTGKNFRPVPRAVPKDILQQHILDNFNRFARNLRLKHMFGLDSVRLSPLHFPNPSFEPDKGCRALEAYIRITKKLLMQTAASSPKPAPCRDPHSKDVPHLLRHLKTNDLVCCMADKNLGLCVLKRNDYHDLLHNYLQDSSCFRRLTYDTVHKRKLRTYDTLMSLCSDYWPANDKGKRPNIFHYVTENTPVDKLSFIRPYLLLKMHKLKSMDTSTLPPVRLIAPCMNTVTEALSRFLDYHIYPSYVAADDHVLKDTPSLIRDLESQAFHPDCVLSVYDIAALHPNIPIREGLQSFHEFLIEANFCEKDVAFFTAALQLCMRNQILQYNGDFYLQIRGTAMGSPIAVLFANVYVFRLARNLVKRYINTNRLLLYKRLIDDMFCVFNTTADAHYFWSEFNALNANIKATGHIGEEVIMLDLHIYKAAKFAASHKLDFKLYAKPFNRCGYIPSTSCHPEASKRSWIKTELQRIVRNSCNYTLYLEARKRFVTRIQARKCSTRTVRKMCKAVTYDQRSTYLTERDPNADEVTVPKAMFITKYTPQTNALKLNKILRKHWNECMEGIGKLWLNMQPVIGYKKAPSLYDKLKKDLPL